MQDDILNAPGAPGRRGMGGRAVAASIAAALLIGAAATAGASWYYGWLSVDLFGSAAPSAPPSASPQPVAAPLLPDQSAKLSALESRLAELDREAAAASGQASRAEGLLIAFAARRAIERGQPLGYLENQLRLRFGQSQPQAVDRVINASTRPITLDFLSEQLARIEPELSVSSPSENSWEWAKREVSELFIIRHVDSPSPDPEQRLVRARQYVAGGRIEAAIDEISRMPGRDAARAWLASARDYVVTERALDVIETAAILQPAAAPALPAPVASPSPSPATE